VTEKARGVFVSTYPGQEDPEIVGPVERKEFGSAVCSVRRLGAEVAAI
jgi:hypothetical protein